MPGSAILLGAALAAPLQPENLQAGASAEVQLVGLGFGLRPELAWAFAGPDRAHRLRVSGAVLIGPELIYTPVDLGYRASLRQGHTWHPELGVNVQLQPFFIGEGQKIVRRATGFEMGVAADLEPCTITLMLAPDWANSEIPSPGMGLRLGVRWELGGA